MARARTTSLASLKGVYLFHHHDSTGKFLGVLEGTLGEVLEPLGSPWNALEPYPDNVGIVVLYEGERIIGQLIVKEKLT